MLPSLMKPKLGYEIHQRFNQEKKGAPKKKKKQEKIS